jgi:hypothetical protein
MCIVLVLILVAAGIVLVTDLSPTLALVTVAVGAVVSYALGRLYLIWRT